MAVNIKCPFCDIEATYNDSSQNNSGSRKVKCPICGTYSITEEMIIDIDTDIRESYAPYKHLISGLIREKNDVGLEIDIITSKNIISFLSDPLIPKTILQKLDKILLHFYRNTEFFGQQIRIDQNTPYSIGYAKNEYEFFDMIDALVKMGYLKLDTSGGSSFLKYLLTLEGMTRAEELLSTNIYSNEVFVAMRFCEIPLLAHEKAIVPACHECGFKAYLVKEIEHNGDITDKIIASIKTSKFVIADFTYNNSGVYFEAGYAQGRGLEVIRTCNKPWLDEDDEKGNKNQLHFDINHYNFILWDNNEDLKEKLINRIKANIL